jgi:G3E family GTPase
MRIVIVGGFLGSGKTTLVRGLIQALSDQGAGPIAVLENEVGREGLDGQLLSRTQVQVTRLYGGCLCCQYAGNLLPAVEEIRAKADPAFLLLELTGLAMLPGVLDVFRQAGTDDSLIPICVADASRWDRLRLSTGEMLFQQAQGARAILLNKLDAVSDAQGIEAQLRQHIPGAAIFSGCLKEGLPDGLVDLLTQT